MNRVCEHIVTEKTSTCVAITVRIDEPLDRRIVVSALQVIEAGLYGIGVAVEAKTEPFRMLKKEAKAPGLQRATPDPREGRSPSGWSVFAGK